MPGEFLLTSVLFDYRTAYAQFIDDVQNDTFGSVYTMNLANDGVRLLPSPIGLQPETTAAVEVARTAIVEGTIVVSAIGDADGLQRRLDELFPPT